MRKEQIFSGIGEDPN